MWVAKIEMEFTDQQIAEIRKNLRGAKVMERGCAAIPMLDSVGLAVLKVAKKQGKK